MRLFVCTLLNDAAQDACARAMAPVLSTHRGVLRPIPARTAHITHAFIGHFPETGIDELARVLTPVAAQHERFTITLGTPFVLYGGSEARLVCAPVTRGADAVQAISAELLAELASMPAARDVSGGKAPHVTLARFRRNTRRSEARPVADHLGAGAILARAEEVTGLRIMSSTLTPAGSVYTVLSELPLAR